MFRRISPSLAPIELRPSLIVPLILIGVLGSTFSGASYGQPVAVDDFYTIDRPMYTEPYENDSDHGGTQMVITQPTYSGATINNWDPFSCTKCPYVIPATNFTGYDSFTYKYVVCCGNPPGPDSNVATIAFLVIGKDDAQNAGACPLRRHGGILPQDSKGEPVNVTNGNMWLEQIDYVLPGRGEAIEINRFYNSIIQVSGLFGLGWSTNYDVSLQVYPDGKMLRLNQPDGRAAYFGRAITGQAFRSFSPDVDGSIVENSNGTYTLTDFDGSIRNFSASGELLSLTDRNGNTTTLSYDSGGALTGVTDSVGRTLTFTPNSNGTVAAISDAMGVIATYEYYSGTSKLKTVSYPDGSEFEFEYIDIVVNNATRTVLTTVKDALGNILEFHEYDNQARAITSEKDGGVEKYMFDYTYDALSSPLTIVTDARGNVTKYSHFRKYATNLISKTEGVCGGCGGSGSEVTRYKYDDRLMLKEKIDALGRVTTYLIDSDRNLVEQVDPLGTQKWTYNSFGQVLTYKDRVDSQNPDPDVNTLENNFDPNGNLLTTKDALGHVTVITNTSHGEPWTITDARGNTSEIGWDIYGRLSQVKDPYDKITTFTYNDRARLTGVTNPLTELTAFEYDSKDRLKKVVYPDSKFVEYTYDLAGRRTAVRDARGNSTSYGYDDAYRLTSITDPLSHSTTFTYDLMSNLTARTDALANQTDFEYDTFNRLKKVIYPPATQGAPRLEETLTYDRVGKVKTRVDTGGRTTTYDYDTSNRLKKITDALSNVTEFDYNTRSHLTKVKDALNQEYVFTYDPFGRLLTQTRAGATMSYEYDEVGNRVKRTDYNGLVTDYSYDDMNRLTQNDLGSFTYDDLSRLLTATNVHGTVSFTYDNRGRVQTTTDVYNRTIQYGYDENGNRTLLKLDGVGYSGYGYDAANRLTSHSDLTASLTTTFAYDNADRLIGRVHPNGVLRTIHYDGMSRLKVLNDQIGKNTLQEKTYSYNNANQISQITEPGRSRTFTYDDLDRLTAVADSLNGNENYAYDAVGNRTSSHKSSTYGYGPFNRLTSTQNATYSYDANGNMTSRTDANGVMTFTHDSDGRLRGTLTDQFEFNEFLYDALGRRILSQSTYEIPREYTYDELDVLISFSGGQQVKYQNGPGIDDKLSVELPGGSGQMYFLRDHLGTTHGTVDSGGTFSPGGALDAFGGPSGDFTGREFDNFTGLYYYRARMYDPELGRFTAEDPIGFYGGDLNLFAYVWNNPVDLVDPLGTQGHRRDHRPSVLQPASMPPSTLEIVRDWFMQVWNTGFPFRIGLGESTTATRVPGVGEACSTLQVGPELYRTLPITGGRNGAINDALRCVKGDCSPRVDPDWRDGLGPWTPSGYQTGYDERGQPRP